jgi:hypothetical protein
LGGLLYQFFAIFATVPDVTLAKLFGLFLGFVLFSLFGGCLSVAMGLNSPAKCIGVGAATPLLVPVLAKAALQLATKS